MPNTLTWKNRTEFGNINHNIPGGNHTLYNPEKEKSSPLYYTARALLLIPISLHLMLFENVLIVNEISSIITDASYIVWLALKQEIVQPDDGQYRGRNMWLLTAS